jgi:hypothetical protein
VARQGEDSKIRHRLQGEEGVSVVEGEVVSRLWARRPGSGGVGALDVLG